jgi:hypothetical protein
MSLNLVLGDTPAVKTAAVPEPAELEFYEAAYARHPNQLKQ